MPLRGASAERIITCSARGRRLAERRLFRRLGCRARCLPANLGEARKAAA